MKKIATVILILCVIGVVSFNMIKNVFLKESIYIKANTPVELVNFKTKDSHTVNNENLSLINNFGKKLDVEYKYIYESPALLIVITNGNSEKIVYSIFADGYIYKGDFTEAFYDRMNGKKSKIIRMNYRLGQLLYGIGQ